MTQGLTLASRIFQPADQESFASVSGDRNPMHVDEVAARRTQAGATVVHGVHLLLWALDALATMEPDLPPIRSLRARFGKFVYVGEQVEAILTQRKADSVRFNVSVRGAPVSQFVVEFGSPKIDLIDWLPCSCEPIPAPHVPLDVDFRELADCSGRLDFATPPGVIGAMFPAAANWIGDRALAVLGASTYLAGMVYPGLYSIFSGLSLDACTEPMPENGLAFRVTTANPRLRLVHHAVAGGGLAGNLECFARLPPTSQATMQSLVGLVGPTEFDGSLALIVGGSRGLGELAAKLIAAGGGRVIITYRVGRDDAKRVSQEIRAAGGACESLKYEVGRPPEEQLADLVDAPTHAYYFATPPIFRSQSDLFTRARLNEFLDTYVDGFFRLTQALRGRQPQLSVFYPSSVAVADRPRGMTEYAMAKAAGELLCDEMNQALAPLHVTVSRLPRMPTDQTASAVPVETASPPEIMLPLIREVQSWPRPGRDAAQ